jgi:zinc protease
MREQGATAPEVERAKRYLVGNYEIEMQKNSALAAMLAFDERYGLGCQEVESYAEHIMAITPEMVQHVARTYLAIDQSAVVIVGPAPAEGMVIQRSAERVVS